MTTLGGTFEDSTIDAGSDRPLKQIGQIGRMPFPADQVEGHMAKLKQRDQIIEKNKKLKTSKKPEEPVPIIDNIEQDMTASEQPTWVLLKNVQFKHVNLCMNDLNDDLKDTLLGVLKRTGEDFGVTLAGNPISTEVI